MSKTRKSIYFSKEMLKTPHCYGPGHLEITVKAMEHYDPGCKRAHLIAGLYQKRLIIRIISRIKLFFLKLTTNTKRLKAKLPSVSA